VQTGGTRNLDLVREIAMSLAGPLVAFGVTLGRILFAPGLDQAFVVPILFAAVVVGAAFGGRWSALATAAIAAVGLVLSSSAGLAVATAIAIAVALAIALVTGELRDRAERAERGVEVANERLRRLAFRDALTGLLDWRGFEFALRVELARESRRGGHFALVLLELGGVRNTNERFGRSVGDTLLQVFGDSVEQRIRQSDIAARVGGDEFAIILPDTDVEGARIVARQIMRAFADNVRGIFPKDLGVGGSLGIARFPDDGSEPDALLGAAGQHLEPVAVDGSG
jgi:diguanylate cyclase (GGDEF)-like protein